MNNTRTASMPSSLELSRRKWLLSGTLLLTVMFGVSTALILLAG